MWTGKTELRMLHVMFFASFGRLQTTHKTAASTFHSCLTRKKYTCIKPATDDLREVCKTCSKRKNMWEMERVLRFIHIAAVISRNRFLVFCTKNHFAPETVKLRNQGDFLANRENSTICEMCVVLVQHNFFSQDSHKTYLQLSCESSVAGLRFA